MRKKPSLETFNFIEDIIARYELEKTLFEGDPVLEKKLQTAKSLEEKRVIRFLNSQKIKDCLELKKPLEEVSAFVAIAKLIEKLINKEITFNDLDKRLESALEKLNIRPKTIEEVSQIIKNNERIIKETNEEIDKETDNEKSLKIKESAQAKQGEKNSKGINQELL